MRQNSMYIIYKLSAVGLHILRRGNVESFRENPQKINERKQDKLKSTTTHN